MDEPTIAYNGRQVSATWDVGPMGDGRAEVVLTVDHLPEKKALLAYIHPQVSRMVNGTKVTTYWLFSGLDVKRRTVSRYSARERDKLLESAIARIPELIEEDEEVREMFDLTAFDRFDERVRFSSTPILAAEPKEQSNE